MFTPKRRKPLIFQRKSNFSPGILGKPVFHIKPSEASFPVGMLENWFLYFENLFLDSDNWLGLACVQSSSSSDLGGVLGEPWDLRGSPEGPAPGRSIFYCKNGDMSSQPGVSPAFWRGQCHDLCIFTVENGGASGRQPSRSRN